QKRNWMDRVTNLSTLVRDKNLRPQKLGALYQCALEIERCYDNDYKLIDRTFKLGKILGKTKEVISIDGELLVLAAASRWLTRSRAYPLANLCLNEYTSICRRLSGGKSADVLGLVGDLIDKPWFTSQLP